MAQSLQQLKARINSSNGIAKITKAMEAIAASKIKTARKSVEKTRAYEEKIRYVVQKILADTDIAKLRNTFLEDRLEFLNEQKPDASAPKKLFFIISPDKGLCGGLVSNIVKKAAELVTENDYVVCIGKKIEKASAKMGHNIIASFPMGTGYPEYNSIYPMINLAVSYYVSVQVASVVLIYAPFKNAFVQEVTAQTLMPITPDENFKNSHHRYLFEPSPLAVLERILPYYIEVEFFNALKNAHASEQAARVAAMSAAKDNALEISQTLTTAYNKIRQEKITNEILDLASAQI
ncbi:MAG: ATP synthase F1 subunit gamma [Elusimicrobia bacterium]|nr:ATP synthase F1 subunit gamma [Elusimicrobiota bacterium]